MRCAGLVQKIGCSRKVAEWRAVIMERKGISVRLNLRIEPYRIIRGYSWLNLKEVLRICLWRKTSWFGNILTGLGVGNN